ncbi:MAG: MotA/TolQ/ExbB proton channel family protein [Gammaproteobacteria bacterium]|nr:MotA/TolQ/ExbB proton channel family protein [Gammaproteobacteria bacterium]
MKTLTRVFFLSAAAVAITPASAQQEEQPAQQERQPAQQQERQQQPSPQSQAQTLEELLQSVQEGAEQRSRENQQRLQRFQQARDEQQALLQEARNQLAQAEQRSEQLTAQFDQNEEQLSELNTTLQARVGDMGELFGVVRQAAGETTGLVDSSLITAQYPDRGDFLPELAETTVLPDIPDLRQLNTLLLQEMVESGQVVRFPTTIIQANGDNEEAQVVRVGVFNAITGDRFLNYNQDTNRLQSLPRQPAGRYLELAENLFEAEPGQIVAMAVDPSRGSLLGLLIQTPSFLERIRQGGIVGYVIIFVGVLGLLIALERFLYLTFAGGRIKRQRNSDTADGDNALGRIMSVYDDNRNVDTETLELKLDEAILKETPALEKRQAIIKVFAAVAPLLGLLGTVVGMIITFQAITLFGTGDPKLMADGISTALVTTVEGLVVAIPLVLLHSLIVGRSRNLIEILEEQSAGMIARRSEQEQRG